MIFDIAIDIMPHKALLDPQGKTIEQNLPRIGITEVREVRMGKHLEFLLEAENKEDALQKATLACEKLLVNHIMESYYIDIKLKK